MCYIINYFQHIQKLVCLVLIYHRFLSTKDKIKKKINNKMAIDLLIYIFFSPSKIQFINVIIFIINLIYQSK